MRLRQQTTKKARIEIIPMIDTMFFLLVFFMMATLSMSIQRGLPVNLPHAATAKEEIKQVITLTLTKDGRLYFDKQELSSPAEVIQRLERKRNEGAQLSVVINADRSVEHGRVVELLDAAKRSGVTKISVAAKPNDQ